MVRLACQEVLGVSPRKRELDGWVRGFYLYARLLSGRLGGALAARRQSPALVRQTYLGPGVDVAAEYERGLAESRAVVSNVHAYMERGEFSRRGTGRFLAGYPDGNAGSLAG